MQHVVLVKAAWRFLARLVEAYMWNKCFETLSKHGCSLSSREQPECVCGCVWDARHVHTTSYLCCCHRSNCAENIRKHILHTGKHEGVKMYNCPKCTFGTNSPMEFRNHLKENHLDIENPDLAYLHAGKMFSSSYVSRIRNYSFRKAKNNVYKHLSSTFTHDDIQLVFYLLLLLSRANNGLMASKQF